MAGATEIYKSARIVTFILRFFLVLEILAALIVAAVLSVAGRGQVGMPDLVLTGYNAVVKSLTILPLTSGLAILFWVYNANRNARALAAMPLVNTPGWSVGWWFVPVASLFKPYQVVLEIYKASRDPADWPAKKQATIVGVWWIINLCGNGIGLFITAASRSGMAKVEMRPAILAMYTLMAVHQTLLLVIVSRIYAWQQKANTASGVEKIF